MRLTEFVVRPISLTEELVCGLLHIQVWVNLRHWHRHSRVVQSIQDLRIVCVATQTVSKQIEISESPGTHLFLP